MNRSHPPQVENLQKVTYTVFPFQSFILTESLFLRASTLFICSSEMNKVNLFPVLTSLSFIFLLNLIIAFKAKLLTNPDKLSLSTETETFLGAFFPELASQVLKNPTD